MEWNKTNIEKFVEKQNKEYILCRIPSIFEEFRHILLAARAAGLKRIGKKIPLFC